MMIYVSNLATSPSVDGVASPATEHYGALIECGHNGSAGLFHARCWTDERTKGPLRKPALGPPGDSLDDFTAHKQTSR